MSDHGRDKQKLPKMWIFEREYSRRQVLKRAGAAGMAAGLSGFLAACGTRLPHVVGALEARDPA